MQNETNKNTRTQQQQKIVMTRQSENKKNHAGIQRGFPRFQAAVEHFRV